MIEKLQLKGGISEVNFGYNAKTVVGTNLSLDITKLAAIAGREKSKYQGMLYIKINRR